MWRRHGDPLGGGTTPGEVLEYFWAHVHDRSDECMLWPFAIGGEGYGHIYVDGRVVPVHALACEVWHGPRPPGTEAGHGGCHTRACWNGAHVSWLTRAENRRDRRRDGTAGKLTPGDVDAIRRRYAAGGITQQRLAEQYGVTQPNIHAIVNGRSWRE